MRTRKIRSLLGPSRGMVLRGEKSTLVSTKTICKVVVVLVRRGIRSHVRLVAEQQEAAARDYVGPKHIVIGLVGNLPFSGAASSGDQFRHLVATIHQSPPLLSITEELRSRCDSSDIDWQVQSVSP